MKNIFILILAIVVLSGCTKMHTDVGWAKPSGLMMTLPEDKPYSQVYKQGFEDGCSSGFGGYANSFNKMFHPWKQDPELAQNKKYYQIWKDAYSYCANWGMMADEHGLGNWR